MHGHRSKEEFNVEIAPKPWPWFLQFNTYRIQCRRLGRSIRNRAQRFCACMARHWREYVILFLCLSSFLLAIVLPVINFSGSRAPRTDLEALTIHNFSLALENTSTLAPWHVKGNFTVIFQARNPSWVSGFTHQYLSTHVYAFDPYKYAVLGHTGPLPLFSQEEKSARMVSMDVVILEQNVSHMSGLYMQAAKDGGFYIQEWGSVYMGIRVDAYVKVKRLGWRHPKWFNMTCLVEASRPNSTRHQAGQLIRKNCTA